MSTDQSRASYRREINYRIVQLIVTAQLYGVRALPKGKHLDDWVDSILKQVKRAKGLNELLEKVREFFNIL